MTHNNYSVERQTYDNSHGIPEPDLNALIQKFNPIFPSSQSIDHIRPILSLQIAV